MAHSTLVLAKFSPVLSAARARMSPRVVEGADAIICCPFLALALALAESHAGRQFGYNVVLFPISPSKPAGEFAEYYASVSLQSKLLRLCLPSQSPLDDSDVLYLHTVPALYLKSGLPSSGSPYQLDSEGVEQLRSLGEDHQTSWLRAALRRLSSGGEETVGEYWDTWSGGDPYQIQVPFGSFIFDYLDSDGIDLRSMTPPSVVEELMTFKKCVDSGRLLCPLTVNADWLWIIAGNEWTTS